MVTTVYSQAINGDIKMLLLHYVIAENRYCDQARANKTTVTIVVVTFIYNILLVPIVVYVLNFSSSLTTNFSELQFIRSLEFIPLVRGMNSNIARLLRQLVL